MLKHLLAGLLLAPDAGSDGGGSGGGESAATPSAPQSANSGSSDGAGGGGASAGAAPDPASSGDDNSNPMQAAFDAHTDPGTDAAAGSTDAPEGDDDPVGQAVADAEGAEGKTDKADPAQPAGEWLSDDEILATITAIKGNPGGIPAAPAAAAQAAPAAPAAAPAAEAKPEAKPEAKKAEPAAIPGIDTKALEALIEETPEVKPLVDALQAQNAATAKALADITEKFNGLVSEIKAEREQAAASAQQHAQAQQFVRVNQAMDRLPNLNEKRFGNGSKAALTREQAEQRVALDTLAGRIAAEQKAKGRELTAEQAWDAAHRVMERASQKTAAAAPTNRAQVTAELRQQSKTRSPAGMSQGPAASNSNNVPYTDEDSGPDAMKKVWNSHRRNQTAAA